MTDTISLTKKYLTVGFSDLDGWIRLNESVGEKQAIYLLWNTFRQIEKIVENYNGDIRKYMGDSILFSFNQISNAINAGKEISTISIMDQNRVYYFYTGLATGTVFEVDPGHHVKDIYGKTVNDAALLTKKAKLKKNRIALCPQTKHGL
jgi:class 3 adenylate cyclase